MKREIILHCSATVEGKNFTAADIDRWHKEKGYKKIGYHFVIDLDGTLEKGRQLNERGAHCKGHNDSIGICYIGGLDKDGKPKDTRTIEQKDTLYRLVYDLMGDDMTLEQIHCHNEFAKKDCPSFKITDFRKEYLNWINKYEQSNNSTEL